MLQNTPLRFTKGTPVKRGRSSRWTILWSFLLTLCLILTATFIATPLAISRHTNIDAKQLFASLRASSQEVLAGVENHGLGWFVMKPVDRLTVGSDPEFVSTIVRAISGEFRVSPELVNAVIQVSSAYDPLAVSAAGSIGLMQITQVDAAQAKVNSASNPWENITVGTRKLKSLIDFNKGNWEKALESYYREAKAISNDKELTRLVNHTLEIYRTEVGKRYPSIS